MIEGLEIGDPDIDPAAFVAPGVQLHGRVEVGAGAVVMFGVVARAELDVVRIGAESNVQDNCVLHADRDFPAIIGRRVTVGHAAVVHGAVIGDGCLVGIGALALNGSEMGEGAWLAAGSVLPEGKVIPPWTLAVGTPARPLRELRDDEVERQRSGVADYLEFAAAYRRRLGEAG